MTSHLRSWLFALAITMSLPAAEPNRCTLLTDAEVREAIGAHSAGVVDIGNEYGLQDCRWTATTAQKDGWHDSIDVTVFNPERTSWARGEAHGEPVKGFVPGALYDSSYGKLWFSCGRGQFCVVKARTYSGGKREQIALQLAQIIEKRLR